MRTRDRDRRCGPGEAGRDAYGGPAPRRYGDVARPAAALLCGALAGSVPFSNIAARWTRGVDLREVGHGTVSGTALYQVAGMGPLVVAGLLDVGKGAVGPLLARDRPVVAALAGAAAVTGHNWSPFLAGAGGRGISPAMGALAVTAWPGSVVLLAGLAVGRMAGQTGAGVLVADAALVPVLARTGGSRAAFAGAAVLVPMVAKRLAGNAPLRGGRVRGYLRRLAFDNDGWPPR